MNKITEIFVLENQVNMFQLPTTLNVRYCFILYMNKHNFFTYVDKICNAEHSFGGPMVYKPCIRHRHIHCM